MPLCRRKILSFAGCAIRLWRPSRGEGDPLVEYLLALRLSTATPCCVRECANEKYVCYPCRCTSFIGELASSFFVDKDVWKEGYLDGLKGVIFTCHCGMTYEVYAEK